MQPGDASENLNTLRDGTGFQLIRQVFFCVLPGTPYR
jgi:hypothetical protein